MTETSGRPSPSPTALDVEVVGRLGPDSAEWDALVARQPLPSAFLRSWWVDHVAAGDARIVLCRRDGRLVGGAAFELDAVRRGPVALERVRMLGQGVLAPDHLDLVAESGSHEQVARAVLAWLRRPGSRLVDLDGLSAGGSLATLLSHGEVERVGAPFTSLPADVDAYLDARPGRVRSTLRRSERRLAKAGAVVRRVDPADAPRALATLARLHDHRWSDRSEFLGAWDRFAAAATEGMQRKEVVVHELVGGDGEVAAIELDLVLGDTVAFYQAGRRTGREWRGAGTVVRAASVRAAAEAGATTYDLLRGDEAYKVDWADRRRELVRCRVGIGPLGAAAIHAERLLERARGRFGPEERAGVDGAISPAPSPPGR